MNLQFAPKEALVVDLGEEWRKAERLADDAD